MTSEEQKRNGRWLLSLLQRGEQWLEISGYHVGDVHSDDKPVAIVAGATMVGNVFAPKVTINGLLCGSIVTQSGHIESEGQVWGDVFAIRLEMSPGGKIQGWLSSIDDLLYEELFHTQTLPDDPTLLEQPSDETVESHLLPTKEELDLTTLHQLQAELATALAARVELENSFEQRINEVAGESANRLTTLGEQLEDARTKLREARDDLNEKNNVIKSRDAQIERQSNELSVSRQLIDNQHEELEQLHQIKSKLQKQLDQVTIHRDDLAKQLQDKVNELEEQTKRMQTLETTMQAGLQHSSELEDSLVRWQELAEVTEEKAEKLEKELEKTKFQLDESSKLVDMLREQKQQAEQEWVQAQEELEKLRGRPTRPLNEDEETEDPYERIAALEAALEEMEQEHAEQILWYRASLETNQMEFNHLQRQADEQQTQLVYLRSDLEKNRSLVDKWKTAADEISTQIREQEKQFKAWREDAETKIATLEARLNQRRLQLEATEEDLAHHIDAIEAQGNHLAEIQSILAEREIQLQEARALIQKQNLALKQLREKAETHIHRLQARIKQLSKG